MAFKLGKKGGSMFHAGVIKRPFRFNGSERELHKTPLDQGTLAEANMDGSITVDPSVNLNSALGKRVLKHEKEHLKQMDEGRAAYDDNWVMWEGKLYVRQNGMIWGPNGKLPEGHHDHPWEAEAIKAEKQ